MMGTKECLVGWTLALAVVLAFASNHGDAPSEDGVAEIAEILKGLQEVDSTGVGHRGSSSYDHEDDARERFAHERTRKAGTTRPKYDPGLKWIGLGKRPSSAPLGPELFSDLRRFFNAAQRDVLRRQENRSLGPFANQRGAVLKQDQRDDHDLKFVTRSKSSGDGGQRKQYYNPSLLWTGLGR